MRALAVVLIAGNTAWAADRMLDPTVVRVYRLQEVSTDTGRAALETAAAIMRAAGVAVTWIDCGQPTVCDAPLAPGERIVRLVREQGAPRTLTRQALGDALVAGGRGAFSTVYVTRVETMARASGAAIDVLIGRVIAHEIGHLLIGTTFHSPTGLMRADWSLTELRRPRDGDWRFTESDVMAMVRP